MRRTLVKINGFGLVIYVTVSAVLGHVWLWALLTLAGIGLGFTAVEALLGAAVAAVGHLLGEVLHNVGHALAARAVGYPMHGVYLWFILGTSLYPRDEGEVPRSAHIRRALGGPLFSGVLTLVLAGLYALAQPSGVVGAVWLFICLDYALVFTIGALLPLRLGSFMNDGATVWAQWRGV